MRFLIVSGANDYMCVEATAYVPKKHRAEGVDITGIARYLAAMRA